MLEGLSTWRRRIGGVRVSHNFKGLKADEVLAPPERRQPAKNKPMGRNVVAMMYVADHKTDAGLQASEYAFCQGDCN